MNTQKIEIVINQLERVYGDINDCSNKFILKDAIDQLQEQVKLFTMPLVIHQCEHDYSDGTGTGYNVCRKCGDMY